MNLSLGCVRLENGRRPWKSPGPNECEITMKTVNCRRKVGSCDAHVAESAGDASSPGSAANHAGRPFIRATRASRPRSATGRRSYAHVGLDDSLKRKLQNPDFRAAYEAEDKRIELVLQIIKLRQ